MPKYSLEKLVDFGCRVLEFRGLSRERALRISQSQIEIHGLGISTHGVPVLNMVMKTLGDGLDPGKKTGSIRDGGAVAVLDCSGCISVESFMNGCVLARKKADSFGLGFVSMLHTGWIGVLGYHLSELAREGYLAIAWAQMSGWPCVAPFGGREGRLSTNPMAFCFPSDPYPVMADFSTAAVSSGKVWQWCGSGKRPPEPLLLDAEGNPTTDPNALKNNGTILPFGGINYGFRGTALSMWIEALTAAAGARPANPDRKGGQSAHVFALKIDSMSSRESYDPLMRDLLSYVLSSKPAPGSDGPVMPGYFEWKSLEKARKEGVDVEECLVDTMKEIGADCGIAMPDPAG